MTKENTGPASTGPVFLYHRVTNIDSDAMIGDCSVCGPQSRLAPRGPKRLRCWFAKNRSSQISGRPYLRFRKDYCEWCHRFLHYCQIDVDHVNNQHDDNSEENLVSLCANCHRLKSYMVISKIPESDWAELRSRYGATPTDDIIRVKRHG